MKAASVAPPVPKVVPPPARRPVRVGVDPPPPPPAAPAFPAKRFRVVDTRKEVIVAKKEESDARHYLFVEVKEEVMKEEENDAGHHGLVEVKEEAANEEESRKRTKKVRPRILHHPV